MAHSPAFQFYPGDFTGDRLTIPMTTLEIGAYWLLICECWDKGNQLPNDLGDLADIARMKVVDFEKIWNKRIKKCFEFDDRKNVFWQKRIAKEIKKQKAWSKKKSDAGKKGMESRWKQKGTEDNTTITVLGSDITQDNSPSLSLSLPSTQEEEEVRGEDPPPTASDFGEPENQPPKESLFGHPVIEALRQVTKKCPPVETRQLLINKVGGTIDLPKLQIAYGEWRSRGYKDTNFDGILDWYLEKENGANRKPNGRYQKRTDADVIEQSADFYDKYPA